MRLRRGWPMHPARGTGAEADLVHVPLRAPRRRDRPVRTVLEGVDRPGADQVVAIAGGAVDDEHGSTVRRMMR